MIALANAGRICARSLLLGLLDGLHRQGTDRNVIRLGAQRIEDLQIILMDDFCPVFILGNHRLEEGIWIVAV